MKEEITDLTKDMVKIPSETGNKQEIQEVLEYIKDYFSAEEFKIEEFENEEARSMVITFNEDENPDLMLHGHIDVVEAEEELFNPTLEDEKIYGRGTGDMKAGVACLMKAMKQMKDEKPSVGLMIVSDEEVGGFKGAKYLFEEHYSPQFAISAEPNNLDGYLDIVSEQKGVMQLKITAKGAGAHGSRPWKGDNAAEKLMDKYQNIKELFEDPKGGEKWVTTVNLGKFESGDSTNRVPDKADLWLDIRYSKQYTPDEILEDVKEIEDIEVEVIVEEPMLHTKKNNQNIQELKKTAEEIIDSCKIRRKEPGSDMRHLTRENIPAVVFGPEGYNSHGSEEYAVINSFEDYVEIITRFSQEKF